MKTIRTEAAIDGRSITAVSEVELPADDMARIGGEFERELRGYHAEIVAAMAKERRRERRSYEDDA